MPDENAQNSQELQAAGTQPAPANPATPAVGVAPKGLPDKQGKRILIVEDERPLSHALEMKLTHQGYQPHVVMNGADAIEAVKKEHYDMILLDLIMPVMDGFAVLTELKNLQSKTPVIVLSNLGQDEDRAKTKDLGAVGYFVKSNTPIADIIAKVQSCI